MWKIKGMALHACSLLNSYGEGSLFLCRKKNFVTEVCMGLETMWSALAAVRPVMEVSSMALRSHLLQALAAEGCPHLEIKWFCLFPSPGDWQKAKGASHVPEFGVKSNVEKNLSGASYAPQVPSTIQFAHPIPGGFVLLVVGIILGWSVWWQLFGYLTFF